jgi:hypothetical protein
MYNSPKQFFRELNSFIQEARSINSQSNTTLRLATPDVLLPTARHRLVLLQTAFPLAICLSYPTHLLTTNPASQSFYG